MLLSVDAKKLYIETLMRTQAFQICASRDPSCDIRGLHKMLVDLYVSKMMYDEGGVVEKAREINRELDNRLAAANGITRTEVSKFLSDLRDDTWMHAKMEEISSSLSQIRQIQERMEDKMTPAKAAPAKVIPIKQETVKAKPEKKVVEPVEAVTPKRKCRTCRKLLDLSEYQSHEGRITSPDCKRCSSEKSTAQRIQELKATDDFRNVTEIIKGMSRGHIFTAEEVASKIGDTSYNYATTVKIFKNMKEVRLAPQQPTSKKTGKKYIKI